MSEFEELLAQLAATQEEQSNLVKALPAEGGEDDEAIQAAAAAAAAEGEGGPKNPDDEDDENNDEELPMAKSITVDGEEVQVVDANALIKSLSGLNARVGEQDAALVKGLTSALDLIKGQGLMIKSLQGQIAKLGAQGGGRKTVLTVHEKPVADAVLAKSQSDEGLTPAVFLAKSHAAFDAKKINGKELTTIDVAIRSNQVGVLDQALITKVLS